jgi:hypothetical protein
MSETLVSQSPEPAQVALSNDALPREPYEATELGTTNTFDYRPVPVAAPVALFLGFCSFLGFFTIVGLGIALFGTLLGAICFYRIRQSKGELGGAWIAATGCLFSLVFLAGGVAWHSFNFATEVPEGFERINFRRDISLKGFPITKGQQTIHPDVAALEGKQVFLKGYMYPERTTDNLTSFLLVKDNEVCCFGGQPSLNDMIMIQMKDGLKVKHHSGLVAVGGVFHAAKTPSPAGYDAVYTLDATHFESARTSF